MMDLLFDESAGAQSITVLRKGTTDWQGDPVGPEEFGESHTIENVIIDHQSTTADKNRKDQYTVNGVFYMPMGSDILPTDRVELPDGSIAAVFGKPFKVALGMVEGVAVRFREVR